MENNLLRIQTILQQSFLGSLLEDESITDISFNGKELWVQHNQKGRYRAAHQPTIDDVRILAKQIADAQKKELTNSEPILDTDLGYLRVNVMHDVISPDGMTFAIRVSRPRLAITSLDSMVSGGTKKVSTLLEILMQAGCNIVISGQTGSGKTELQKMLVGYIPKNDIITLIEDTRDSHIKTLYPEKNINSWQTLTMEESSQQITIQELVKSALRNNPDWIIVSETRGKEAVDMLDSAKTDHSIITTLHAKGAMNIPSRLISMIRQSPGYSNMDEVYIGKEIAEFLRFGIHLELDTVDGKYVRKIKEIVEYTNFTNTGVQGIYIYREGQAYNNNKYEVQTEFNALSDPTLNLLMDKRLYHLLPDVFKGKAKDNKHIFPVPMGSN